MHDKDLFVTSFNLIKAFDVVSRDVRWMVLRKLGVPERMLSAIMSIHQGMMASITSSEEVSDPFIASLLLALYFSLMLEKHFIIFKNI